MAAPARQLLPRQLLSALLLAGVWQAAVSQEPFHCDVALNNYVKAWSRQKKEWCCQEMQIACEGSNFTTAAPSTTPIPQVDPGNTLAMAPIADWPKLSDPEQGDAVDDEAEDKNEAEEQFKPCEDIASGGIFWGRVRRETGRACWDICQEEQLRVRIAPWLALTLLGLLDLFAIWQAIGGCRSKATQDSWAVGLQLANRLFLEAPLCAAAALWLILAGPSLLILDSERPAVCFKALGAALVALPSLEQVGVPVEIAEKYEAYEIYASCAIGLLCGFVRFVWAEAAGGGICCWWCGCCCCCCCRRQKPDGYEHRRPLLGSPPPDPDCNGRLLCCEVSEPAEAHGLVNRARIGLQFGSLLGVALAIDLACLGQIFMTLAAFCGIAVGVRESAHALKLNRGVVEGRTRDVYCPWGSDAAMLCEMSNKMGWSTSELLEKYGLQGATESCIYMYIALILLVAGELPDHADLVLTLLVALISLYAMLQGVGRGSELCSAERERLATTQGLHPSLSARREHHHDSHHHQHHQQHHHHRGMQESTFSRDSASSLNSSREKVQYRGCLIQFQDYNGRKALERLRLRFAAPYRACEALPVIVGLALWCKGGMLVLGYAVGLIFAVSWEVLHPRERPGGGWLASLAPRVLEPLLWPAYSTFAPLHLADPTRDHSEKHHRVDHLVFPAWLGVRSLYILILWSIALTSSDCVPLLPEFFSVRDLKDPTQVQRLIAWCWVLSGCVAAGLFPLLGLYMHSKRQFWVDEDWNRLMQHETGNDHYEIASDINSIPVLYPEWSQEEKRLDRGHVEDTPLDKLAALDFFSLWQDVRSGKIYEESGLPDVVHLFTGLFSYRMRWQSKQRVLPVDYRRHEDRMDRLDPRARDPYAMHHHGDPMERGFGGYRQVPTRDDRRDDRRDERYWQTQLPGDMAMTEPATRARSKEGYNELPPLIPHEVKKDSELRLQVPMDDLLDPLVNSLDVFFAHEFVKYLNARIDHEYEHALVVSKLFQDALGEEARREPQVMVKKIQGRPGVLGVLAADPGSSGADFGELARTRNGDFLLMHGGLPVVVFELGDIRDRNFTAFPVLAGQGNVSVDRKRYLAQAGCGLHGLGHNWNFRAVPGTDAVLLISCMLAIALLIHESELGRNHY
eukprot:TRINITY_DN2950_c0_g1_i3.p1 TRINITY_DN2950_c0_g1~~TRINITY_DN2950_c0_g1_i3.p1  ORF type:complete len:1136 (+),score=201.88 TRINITY_DN2950_c0_g1_i3:64-3471(+)